MARCHHDPLKSRPTAVKERGVKVVFFGPEQALGADYPAILSEMHARATAIAKGAEPEMILMGEHALAITLGRSRAAHSQIAVQPSPAPIYEVERGGGATLHHPGQLVVYPLLRLAQHGLSPVSYLRLLEQVVIEILAEQGITAQARAGETGVWTGGDAAPRKVASIGVAVREGVSLHGLALNVDNDLSDFKLISPCGFSHEVMTNTRALGSALTLQNYQSRMLTWLESKLTHSRISSS